MKTLGSQVHITAASCADQHSHRDLMFPPRFNISSRCLLSLLNTNIPQGRNPLSCVFTEPAVPSDSCCVNNSINKKKDTNLIMIYGRELNNILS